MKDPEQEITAQNHIRSILDSGPSMWGNVYEHYIRKVEVSSDEMIEFIMGYHDINQDTSKEDIKKIIEENYADDEE